MLLLVFTAAALVLIFVAVGIHSGQNQSATNLNSPASIHIATPEKPVIAKKTVVNAKPSPVSKVDNELNARFHPPKTKYSVVERMKIFYEYQKGMADADDEADREYPYWRLEGEAARRAMELHSDLYNKRQDALDKQLPKKYHISFDQLGVINAEGFEKKWVTPDDLHPPKMPTMDDGG